MSFYGFRKSFEGFGLVFYEDQGRGTMVQCLNSKTADYVAGADKLKAAEGAFPPKQIRWPNSQMLVEVGRGRVVYAPTSCIAGQNVSCRNFRTDFPSLTTSAV